MRFQLSRSFLRQYDFCVFLPWIFSVFLPWIFILKCILLKFKKHELQPARYVHKCTALEILTRQLVLRCDSASVFFSPLYTTPNSRLLEMALCVCGDDHMRETPGEALE